MALIDIFNAFLEFFGNVRSAFPKINCPVLQFFFWAIFFLSKWIFCYYFCTFIYFCLISFFVFVSFNSGLNTSSVTQANTHEQFKYDGKYFHFMHCAVFLSTLIWFFFIFEFFVAIAKCADDAQNEVFTEETVENGIYFFCGCSFSNSFLFIFSVYWPFVSIFFEFFISMISTFNLCLALDKIEI